jgi:hypothetical protein
MRLRDRFYTATTAKAILSWRIAAGVAVAIALAVADLPVVIAVAGGVAVYAALVAAAMPRSAPRPRIDPFSLGDPWRRFVQGAQRVDATLRRTVAGVEPGPLRDRLADIAARLDHAIAETWAIAKRGDEIDDAVRRLDPTALRSRRATLQAKADQQASDDLVAALESVDRQIATADRLRELSSRTADRLRVNEARLDELVARASEVAVGSSDTDVYASEVDDLVVELEGLRLAVEETRDP